MRRWTHARAALGLSLTFAAVFAGRNAFACGACRGAGGAGGALTASDERYNLTLSTLGRVEIGTWDAHGRAHAEPDGVHALDAVSTLSLTARIVRLLELSLAAGAGTAWLDAPGYTSGGMGWIDVTARARLDLSAEDPANPGRPAVATWLLARAPTGSLGNDRSGGGTAARVGAFGLGAWELSAGADLRRSWGDWQPFIAAEGGYRLADHSNGVDRTLGPRFAARAGLTWFATDVLALASLVDYEAEGDTTLQGHGVAGSWQQRTSLVLALSAHLDSGLRLGGALASDVLIDSLGRNAAATVRLAVSIGFSAVEPAWRRCPIEPVTEHPCGY